MRAKFCPSDHPIFRLVPGVFERHFQVHREALGRPVVAMDSFWEVYNLFLHAFVSAPFDQELSDIIRTSPSPLQEDTAGDEPLELLPLPPLRQGVMVEKPATRDHAQGGPRGVAFEYVGGLAQPQVPQPLRDAVNGDRMVQDDNDPDGDECDLFAETRYMEFSDDEGDDVQMSILG